MKIGFRYIILAAILVLMAAACKKGNDSVPAQYIAYLDVVNATDSVFNIYLNGTRLNVTSNIYAGSASGYLKVPAYSQNYAIRHPINIYANPLPAPADAFRMNLNLDTSAHYSVFICGSTVADTVLRLDADSSRSFTKSNVSYAKIRFAHLAPSFGKLSMAIDDTVRFTGASYKTVTPFTTATHTNKTNSSRVIKIYAAGSATPIASTILTLQAGTIYTFFVKDTKTSGQTTATAGYMLNN